MHTALAVSAETIVGGGAIALLSLAIGFTGTTARRARADNLECRRENAICNWRQTVLIEVMHNAGMPVPSWIWTSVPDDVTRMSPEEQRGMAQRMIDPFGDTD